MISKYILISMIVIITLVHSISCGDGNKNDNANSPMVKPRRSLSKPTPSTAGNGNGLTKPNPLTKTRSVRNIDGGANKPNAGKPIVKNTPPVKPVVANKSPPTAQSEPGIGSHEDNPGQGSKLARLNDNVVKPASSLLLGTMRYMWGSASKLKQSIVGNNNDGAAAKK